MGVTRKTVHFVTLEDTVEVHLGRRLIARKPNTTQGKREAKEIAERIGTQHKAPIVVGKGER